MGVSAALDPCSYPIPLIPSMLLSHPAHTLFLALLASLLTQRSPDRERAAQVWDAVFSADSAYLVTASSDQTARLWDVSQGETIRHYTGHHKAVICVALHDRANDQ